MNATIGHSVSNLSPDQQKWFQHNVNLAIKNRAVPFTELADGRWSALEHGPENIPQQFLQWLPQWPVPGIRGKGICIGAILRDGSVFRGEGIPAEPPKQAPVKPPTATRRWGDWMSKAPKPEAAAAVPVAPTPSNPEPTVESTLIAKAKAALARGVGREAVLKVLRNAGIINPEI